MKIKEAKEIIGSIVKWNFLLQGITERIDVEKNDKLINLSLEDLINANKKVKQSNKRAEKYQKKSKKGIFVSITLDDRLIAAIYTALHYETGNEIIALINDKAVVVIKPKY